MEVEILLKINQLCVRYPDGNQVLNQLSFHIETGETVGIVGANGAGKSTLLKSIVGIILPGEGSIEIDEISCNCNNLGYGGCITV